MKNQKIFFVLFCVLFLSLFFFPIPLSFSSSDSITYNYDSKKVIVIGYNDSNPCNFTKVYEAEWN